jgi:superfamily II DNA helicase RecQ
MIWGGTGFRKDFLRIGDMRVFMPDPNNAPMCAATATCSPSVKEAILSCLHMNKNLEYINLGNWRPNLCYGIHVMRGGRKSYHEVSHLFQPRSERFEDTRQALVFVEDYVAAHNVAFELRKFFGLTGDAARAGVAIFHSLIDNLTKADLIYRFKTGSIRVMVTTEALTMVCSYFKQCYFI